MTTLRSLATAATCVQRKANPTQAIFDLKTDFKEIKMTKRLLLMRHAKSDWNDSRLSDKERPLNARGRSTAPLMANWLAIHELMPEIVLCSSATRTQQTLELMLSHWTEMQLTSPNLALPRPSIEDQLYLASDASILSMAKAGAAHPEHTHCVLVLGHNPGMELLASKLSQRELNMPTGSIGIFKSIWAQDKWPDDWNDDKMWEWGGLVKPRELNAETI